jgi:hypothetical protein
VEQWTEEENVTPTRRHELDQIEAWAVETVNELARIQAKFYNDLRASGRPEPPQSRLTTCEGVASLIGQLDDNALRALVYVFTSHAGHVVLETADAVYTYEQHYGHGPDEVILG